MPAAKAAKKNHDDQSVSSKVSARVGHDDAVFEWRQGQFEEMGFSKEKSAFLADTRIDLEKARKMKKDGCSLELIEDILLGTTPHGEDHDWYKTDTDQQG